MRDGPKEFIMPKQSLSINDLGVVLANKRRSGTALTCCEMIVAEITFLDAAFTPNGWMGYFDVTTATRIEMLIEALEVLDCSKLLANLQNALQTIGLDAKPIDDDQLLEAICKPSEEQYLQMFSIDNKTDLEPALDACYNLIIENPLDFPEIRQ